MGNEGLVLSRLLARLSDGDFHSGGELGRSLGVSRAAVWKQLRKLAELGLELESVRGKGYRIEGGLELLDRERLWGQLTPGARERLTELALFTVTDSTNTRAMERASVGQSGYLCLAEQQTAGRGRRGRAWVSPFGRNLYLSVSWAFDGGASRLEGLSLAVGVVLCQCLEAFGLREVRLKWPNDVLWRDRKLAGVLLEMTGDPAGRCQVVVGVGVNLAMPAQAAESIDQPWVDLAYACRHEGCDPPGRNALAARLTEALVSLLADYHQRGFSAWRQGWLERDAFLGKTVAVAAGAGRREGVARGVDQSGALQLAVDGELVLCHGGELTVRAVS